MEGVVDRILAELSDQYLPVPVSVGESEHNSWREANYDVHDADWFHSHARPTAQILYIGQHSDIPKLERLIAIHPGFVYLPEDPSAAPITAISDTLPDERLIELYERAGFRALAAHTDERAASSDSVHTRLFARCHGIIIEDQNASSFHTVTISPIPISTRGGNPASLRGKYGLTVNTPVVLAHVGSEAIAAPLVHAFRRSTAANGRNAFLIMLGPKEEGRQPDQAEAPLIGSFPGRTFRKGRGEYRWYKDYLALADAIYVAPDVSPVLASQFAADAKANAKPLLVETTPEAIDGALNPIFDKTPSVETSKASQIAEAMDRLVADSPIKNMQMLLEKIPTSVRDCSPSIADLEDVAIAIAANETATRAPQLLLDVSGLRGLRPPSHLDHRTKAIVQQILTMPLSKRAETVRFDGNGFVYARDLAMQALDIDLPLKNEVLRVRPGDCIIGIDCLRSFDKESWRELETFAQQGAGLTYIEAGKAFFDNPEELCDAIRKYFDHRNSAKANDAAPRSRTSSLASAMLDAGVPVEIVEIKSDDFPRKDYSYVVTGHVLGTYSLAIINRAVSTALEAAHPGRVSVAPVETDPISDLSHMPMDERPLIERLALRSPRGGTNNVIISQHYPVLTPGRNSGDVALALFAHEETRVLPAVAATLNTGFDGILATSTTVAKTLIDSGVTLPVAAIGQPSSSDLYEQLGRITRPNRPISSFLHVSSCFPRKGIDVLLDAWRLAFTINSRVKLVIKTFPNPHNDIEQRIGALRTAHPDVAPIELINEDLDGESLAELYMRADCMVLPTRGEGYNLPALEAMLARLPLIVTGAGGHLDFCSADDARFIHYTMAPSQSHVRSALSLWAEPDVDDLAHALKQAVDPIHLQAIRARAQRARFTALGAADKQSWVARLDAAVDDLEKAPAKRMPKVAWVSTWGVQCGIAQHSEFLFAGLDNDRRSSFAMLCDLRTEPDQGTFVCPTWRSGEHPQRDAIAQEVEAFEADAVVIQHQDGLIAWSELARICDDPRLNKRILVIVLHNPRAINNLSESESRRVKQALRKAARVIVHNVSDVNLMASHGLSDNVTLLPPGVLPARRTPDVRSLNPAIDAPVIGCHGFAFPHKGIDKLIRAAAQLRHRWPGVRLRLVTAEFPDQKSRDTLIGLRHLVAELGLTDAVEWHTSFLPVEEIQDLLSGCDLLVLPYDQSQDSASGAARICLSSLAPTLATRVKIFEEMQHAFATIDGNDPDNLAEDIATLLSQSEMRLAVQNKMAAWLSDFDWTAMMDLTIGMISGLANQRRVGWD
jgi:glycosyltransferase involved in cell wall biosynthesis